MVLLSSEITFDNSIKTYYAGQTVNGKVNLNIDSPKKVRAIIFKISGKAHTSWSEGSGNNSRRYSAVEKYFKIEYNLLGNHTEEVILPIGKQSYSFTCVLPPSLPPSFEGTFGYIRYTVKVTLDRPWKFDHVIKSAFTVISNLDLNSNPLLRNPVKVTREKRFGCCCCRSKPLSVTLSLPFTGYVPGQNIPFTVEVDNGSDVTVNAVQINLVKVVTYHSTNLKKKKKVQKDIISGIVAIAPIYRGQSRTGSQDIQVPVLPPSNLNNCTIIDLEYKLQITCKVSGVHLNHSIKVPITIGTIPLVSMQSSIVPNNADNAMTGIVGWNTAAGTSTTNYAEMPPPTYEESQFGTQSIAEDTDNKFTIFSNQQQNFAPRYPVYSFPPLPQYK